MQTVQYLLPSFLAGYFINNDDTNLDQDEIDIVKMFKESTKVGTYLGSVEWGFYKIHDMFPEFRATDCSMFTFEQ